MLPSKARRELRCRSEWFTAHSEEALSACCHNENYCNMTIAEKGNDTHLDLILNWLVSRVTLQKETEKKVELPFAEIQESAHLLFMSNGHLGLLARQNCQISGPNGAVRQGCKLHIDPGFCLGMRSKPVVRSVLWDEGFWRINSST